MSAPILEARDVVFAYRHEPVIAGVSLSVRSGEFLGLLGPNGSGKSTLLKLLYGYIHPAQGVVTLGGAALKDCTPHDIARRIAVVPQETPETFGFTVSERVLMGRHPYLSPFGFETQEDLRIAHEAMELTGISHLADRTFNEMSGGERQRAAIAAAVAQTPEILLLDEPTAMLDIKYQSQILLLLRQLNRQRRMTIVMTIHDVNLAAMVCDRIVLLKAGHIMHDGPPSDVLNEDLLQQVYDVRVQRKNAVFPFLDDEP